MSKRSDKKQRRLMFLIKVFVLTLITGITIASAELNRQPANKEPAQNPLTIIEARKAFGRIKLHQKRKGGTFTNRLLHGDSEFFFAEVEGRKSGVNAFLLQHAAQLGLTSEISTSLQSAISEGAWQSFQKIKFRGTQKGTRSTWRSIGPETVTNGGFLEPKNISGRVTDLATGISCDESDCRLYAGTAGGGLWRTDRALDPNFPRWRLLSNGLDSNNIGSVTLDSNDSTGLTLYVGTGESNFTFTSAAGKGLFRSTDGGESFNKIPTNITDPEVSASAIDFTATRGISQVAIKPGEPNTIYLATTTAMLGMTAVRGGQSNITGMPQAKVGLYRTTDGGENWTLLFEAPVDSSSSTGTHTSSLQLISGVKDIQFDPMNPDTVYISVADDGLFRSSPELDGDSTFHLVFEVVGSSKRDSNVGFDQTIKDGQTRIYAYNGNGSDQTEQALYRLDNANQPHTSLFDGNNNGASWVKKSVFVNSEDFVDFEICRSQCVYDLVVATPDGKPDTVYIGGVATRSLGDSTIRSIDAGENFFSHAIDLLAQPGRPHVDVRAIVFSPDNPNLAFVGSDGGVVRTTGRFSAGSGRCTTVLGIPTTDPAYPTCQAAYASVPQEFVFMNHGLQTMQLFNISADPNDPLGRIMAGTQDNSTQWYDGTGAIKNWTRVFNVGDGTSANGFHRENPDILFASFQTANFFTHFRGGRGGNGNWYFTGGPIQFSNETQFPNTAPGSGRQFITFDPIDADTQFTGFERIWRTQNNGGSEADLVSNSCAFSQNYFKAQCGDWEALGDFLTRDNFGSDRSGGVIVAAERSAGDTGTLWAGTSLGRVFVSNNVNASPASVDFDRLDTSSSPTRFVSGIAVDPNNPNRAFVSYSGFSAVTPEAPGHVFEVLYDGTDASFTSLDFNLGDIPVNHLVLDDVTGDLFAATDFGVLVLTAGGTFWELAGNGLPVVLTPHLEIHPQKRLLFAATHGMGGWYMVLRKGE
ncbi:MAG: hypothetical protein ACI9H8_000309 [Lysobacterales bacterium]